MPRRRRTLALLVLAALAVGVGVAWWCAWRDGAPRREALTIDRAGARIRGTVLVPDGVDRDHPAPAVLVAHGLGGDRDDVAGTARALVRAGYVVVTWDARGSGRSTGAADIASPEGAVADVSAIVDRLARRDDVQRDDADPDDPRVAVVGTSYGGGTALLAAERDERIDATASIFGWFDLERALEPNGVLKLQWASNLFASGGGGSDEDRRRPVPCANLAPTPCRAWEASARAGAFTPEARRVLGERSPASLADRLDVPTLLVQGQMDSLFDLHEALDAATALRRNHAPVRVEWVRGGHDLPLDQRRRDHLHEAVLRWLDRHLRQHGSTDPGPRFTVELGAGRGYAHAPVIPPRTTWRSLRLTPTGSTPDGDFEQLAVPAAGLPAELTTLPGFGDLTGVDTGTAAPAGQRAAFATRAARSGLEVVGAPRVRLRFTGSRPTALAFVRLVDVARDGRRIVTRGLVTPVRLVDLPPLDSTEGRTVDVDLPPVAWRLAPGHHFEVEVASTDAGYVAPEQPAILRVAPAEGVDGTLQLPLVDASQRSPESFDGQRDWRDLLVLAAAILLVPLGAALVAARAIHRRTARVQEPAWRDVPLVARDLTKRYRDGRLAVSGTSFVVDPGSVVGIVGPNGAGKTTTIRMLLGLVHPTNGSAHVFGQLVRPGSPYLARIGALVDGPGLVEHLTGRQHLQRYWSATGRPAADAGIDEALAAVDLVRDADRVVRTWSHGMRQRLGIAQALLGAPPLVLLDEPANGLDPAQIAHLRELVRAIAAQGRSVLVSSHLLGELEQVCTHVVLMAEGQVLRSGTLDEVVGEHAGLEAAFLALLSEDAGEEGDDA